MVLNVEEEDLITVNMGVPEFEPNKIPFRAKQSEKPTFCVSVNTPCFAAR